MRDEANVRVRLNSRLLPILVGVVLLMAIIDAYRGWSILLAGLGGAWLIGYLWARALAARLGLVREMRFGWAQVGDQLQERLTLVNDSSLPALWVRIIDHSTLPDHSANSVRAVGGRSSHRWYLKGVCTQRGLFSLGPTSIRTGDPLGLYSVERHLPAWTDLMVTPPIVPLPAIEVAPGGRAGEGRPRPNAFERTVSAAGVRGYAPGDSLRWVHWPTSARRESLYVRLFESTPSGDWWVVLDLYGQAQAGAGFDSTVEHGIILAASLADRGLRASRAVGLVCDSEELIWRPPQLGDDQRQLLLRDLALVAPGPRPLSELLTRIPPAWGRLTSLILITPDTSGNWVDALLGPMRRGVVPTVLLLDPRSFDPSAGEGPAGAQMARLGIAHSVITRDLLDRPEARPGRLGPAELRVTPTGGVITAGSEQDADWEALPS